MRPVAGFAAMAVALLLAIVTASMLAIALLQSGRDPFDKFEVIGVDAEQRAGRHAATYRYHHANSSSDLYATWILTASPPIGSTEPPTGRGEPALAWINGADVVARRWSNNRLVVTVAKGADRRPGRLDDCYFAAEYERPRPVCFDPRTVQITGE